MSVFKNTEGEEILVSKDVIEVAESISVAMSKLHKRTVYQMYRYEPEAETDIVTTITTTQQIQPISISTVPCSTQTVKCLSGLSSLTVKEILDDIETIQQTGRNFKTFFEASCGLRHILLALRVNQGNEEAILELRKLDQRGKASNALNILGLLNARATCKLYM